VAHCVRLKPTKLSIIKWTVSKSVIVVSDTAWVGGGKWGQNSVNIVYI